MTEEIRARTSELETRQVEGEMVLLDLRSQRYLSLNRTGAQLWPLMVEGTSRDRLVHELRSAHDIDEATAGRDVDVLIDQLRGADLLESEGPAPVGGDDGAATDPR